nr:ATP-binding protein [Bowmanella dokdonensis]
MKTIRSQFMLALGLLITLFLAKSLLSFNIQSSFIDTLDNAKQSVTDLSLVRELQRDILDLQRNLLIFKEKPTDANAFRFEAVLARLKENLQKLALMDLPEDYRQYPLRLEEYLLQYAKSFAEVRRDRHQRDDLLEKQLKEEFVTVRELLVELQTRLDGPQQVILRRAKEQTDKAEMAYLNYLLTPDFTDVSGFNNGLLKGIQGLRTLPESEPRDKLLVLLNSLLAQFEHLTRLTRNYDFLVNVTMAGSANEFLYLVRDLNNMLTTRLTSMGDEVLAEVRHNQWQSDLFSLGGILIAVLTALYFSRRITHPVNHLTRVFRALARDEAVDHIPQLRRKDEIGMLARAADVFRARNEQTKHLLAQAQQLIEQQEKLNQELADEKQRAEAATLSKSVFLANMSHEIRTPMNGIIGLVELCLQTRVTNKQREYLQKVAQSSTILMSLINDILDFSKIEAGKLKIEQIAFPTESLLENVLSNAGMRAREKNLNIFCYASPDLPDTLIGDPLRLTQIMLNLTSNAIKFTETGQVNLRLMHEPTEENGLNLILEVQDTGIGISESQRGEIFTAFTQADGSTSRRFGGTGLGLSIVRHLCEMMEGDIQVQSELGQGSCFRVRLPLQAGGAPGPLIPSYPLPGRLAYLNKGQTGYVDYRYLQALAGDYQHFPYADLDSLRLLMERQDCLLVDIGSKEQFSILAPHLETLADKGVRIGIVTATQPHPLPDFIRETSGFSCLSHPFTPSQFGRFITGLLNKDKRKGPVKNASGLPKLSGHLLLVEDNPINQLVVGEMLKSMGLTYDLAEDGRQAVNKINNSPHYDLVLMDIQMPELDGYRATRELREQGFDKLTICGLSANALPQDREKAEQAGMNDYLTKPIRRDELFDCLEKYLSPSTAADQNS